MKLHERLAIVGVLIALVGCASDKPDYAPLLMHIEEGGPDSSSIRVTYDDRGLRYFHGSDYWDLERRSATKVRPSEQEWRIFFEALKEIDVWSWEGEYSDPDPMLEVEGAWHVVIVYFLRGDYSVIAWGSSAYPPNRDQFISALGDLLQQEYL